MPPGERWPVITSIPSPGKNHVKMMQDITPQKRLKIAMVIDSYDDCKNGAAISTRRFVEMLRKDHDVSIITTGDPALGKIVMPRFYVPIVKHIMKRMNTPLAVPAYSKLKKVIQGMDIVHIQFPFFLGIRSVRIAARLKIPVISTFHIQAEHLAMNAGIHSTAFIRYCYKIWIKRIYNRSAMVICPSEFARDELIHYGLKAPTMIISNGILPIFKPCEAERPDRFKDKFIILSVGRFAPEKQQEIIIRALRISKHHEKLQFILIGEGPLKQRLQESGNDLPNQPEFLSLTPEELVKYYNMADLYVHAATVEVECMTVLEAMGCGLPALIADSPKSATKQFAIDERFLFPCGDMRKLSEKIDYCVDHPGELKEAGRLYQSHSLKFRIEKSYEKLLTLYENTDLKSRISREVHIG
jgi:glycosyltransferase involved in cell wall biosynthesis